MTINWKSFYEKEAEFKRFTPEYDELEILRTNMVMSLLPSRDVTSVLDAGCGDGYLCYLFKQRGFERVVGVDLAEGRTKYARSRFPEVVFGQADIHTLPFKNDSFQLVAAVEVLEHLEDVVSALNELKRVSARYVLITVPNNQRLQEVICPYCLRRFFPDGHIQSFNQQQIRSICGKLNLRVKQLRVYKPIERYWLVRIFRPILKRVFSNWLVRGGAIGCLLEK